MTTIKNIDKDFIKDFALQTVNSRYSASNFERFHHCSASVPFINSLDLVQEGKDFKMADRGTLLHEWFAYAVFPLFDNVPFRFGDKEAVLPTTKLDVGQQTQTGDRYIGDEQAIINNGLSLVKSIIDDLETIYAVGIEDDVSFTMKSTTALMTGTCDLWILATSKTLGLTLYVLDLKTGLTPVPVHNNGQLMYYTVGILPKLQANKGLANALQKDGYRSVNTIIHGIIQHKSYSEEMVVVRFNDINDWYRRILFPTVSKLAIGQVEFKAGQHCKFCVAKAKCNTFLKYTFDPLLDSKITTKTLSDMDIKTLTAKGLEESGEKGKVSMETVFGLVSAKSDIEALLKSCVTVAKSSLIPKADESHKPFLETARRDYGIVLKEGRARKVFKPDYNIAKEFSANLQIVFNSVKPLSPSAFLRQNKEFLSKDEIEEVEENTYSPKSNLTIGVTTGLSSLEKEKRRVGTMKAKAVVNHLEDTILGFSPASDGNILLADWNDEEELKDFYDKDDCVI